MKSFFAGSLVLLSLCCLSATGCRSAGNSFTPAATSQGSQTRQVQPGFQSATQPAGSGSRSAPAYQGSGSR